MDYIDAATTRTLLPHNLPIMDLKKMLAHIEETLPPTLHLPVSSEDTLYFYSYLCTHVLIANKQFLLLIDVPIQDRSQQISIYKIFTLDIPHGNSTALYDINTQYFGITQDKTMAVEMSPYQFSTCQEANGQFCNVVTPFQSLMNLPSCITALYTKNTCSILTRCSLQIRKTQDVSIPSQLTPGVWILTTPPSGTTTAITLICPGETSKFITIQKPIYILWLPQLTVLQCPTSIYPTLWKLSFRSQNFFVTLFSLEQNNFFLEHKLLPVHLMGKHYSRQDTYIRWCLRKIILYNNFLIFCQIFGFLLLPNVCWLVLSQHWYFYDRCYVMYLHP